MHFRYFYLFIAVFIRVNDCISGNLQGPLPYPLAQNWSASASSVVESGSSLFATDFHEPNGVLTLRQALALSLIRNPELATFSWEIRAQEARELQAGLIPNPEFGTILEQFAGSGAAGVFDSAQTTVQLSQRIETGQKRLKRKRVAVLDRALSEWDYESKRLSLMTDVAKAFTDVLVLQERITLRNELVRLSEQVSHAVSERVKAGKVPPLEETKATVAFVSIKIELQRAERELDTARKQLAAFWGGTTPVFSKVEGNLYDFGPVPDANQMASWLSQNPDIARWDTELKQRRSAAELEKAKAIPDVTVIAGAQYLADLEASAFVVGVAVPLPVFDRNQGGIREAKARLSKGFHESQAADVKVRTAFAEAYQSLAASFEQASVLKDRIIPSAQSAFDAAREGYTQGRYGYLELLDAQRTSFEVRGRYIEALATYHRARLDLERLIGRGIELTVR